MDFTTCFNLLAARPAHARTSCEDSHDHHHHDDRDVENLAAALNEQLDGIGDSKAVSSSALEPEQNGNDPQEPLEALTVAALTRLFFKLQETRVQIYSAFQKGFDVHQQTAQFPEFSAGITARFSSVSIQINKIEKELGAKNKQVLAQYVRKIQIEEKEKLLMVRSGSNFKRALWSGIWGFTSLFSVCMQTSALLIEKMRLRDAMKQPEPDAAITALLDKSIDALSTQHTVIILRINELLDELRMEIDGEE